MEGIRTLVMVETTKMMRVKVIKTSVLFKLGCVWIMEALLHRALVGHISVLEPEGHSDGAERSKWCDEGWFLLVGLLHLDPVIA